MSPLQKIAMGLVFVVLPPAILQSHPHPEWAVYDALPDPIGWALVLRGIHALNEHLDVDFARMLAWAALALSIPLWFPQVNHLLVPKYNPAIDVSFQWFISLPTFGFSLVLAHAIGKAGASRQPRDVFVAGRFGLMTWGQAASILLPVVAYGGGVDALIRPTQILIGLVGVAFVYYLFRVHRREWLGGPGPLLIKPREQPENREGRPPST